MTDVLQRLSEEEREKVEKTSMPEWMNPMLAKLSHEHFSDEQWIYERKLDGVRIIAYVRSNDEVQLMSRNQNQVNDSYPEIEEALKAQVSVPCILDGEIVAFNKNNVTDFQKLQGRMHVSDRDEAIKSSVKVFYYLFDCLFLDGYDITKCSLRDRKKLLRDTVKWEGAIRWTPHRNKSGEDYYQEACRKGWEGVLAKDAQSEYVHGRSSKWLKFKCVHQQELIICGYTDPKGKRIGFGALLLGYYRDSELVYAGRVGTGFDDETLRDLHERLDKLERKTSPFDVGDPAENGVHFVTPELICEIGFSEWTSDGKLRHPRYLGLRHDKEPEDVHKEA